MKIYVGILLLLLSNFCFTQKLSDGTWTGQLEYSRVQPPFTFEVQNTNSEVPIITIVNGKDRQVLENAVIEGDSIFIPLNPFDAALRAKYSGNEMRGIWRKNYRRGNVPFSARPGGVRFRNNNKWFQQIERKWRVEFKPGTADKYLGVGLLEQEGNRVTGTILTEVGDFRFFEGILDGDSIKMSTFDGVHGFMIKGRKTSSGWSGKFYFDKNYDEDWVASYDANAELQDPFEMVAIGEIKHKPYFDLLGAGSGRNSIDVSRYAGKVVIIQVFGTWCPNSFDQTKFLVDWHKSRKEGVEVVASTYEPNYSRDYGTKRIEEYKRGLEVPYDIYLGGKSSKADAAFAFPFIDKINAFPTLVILDKNGFARYVHSYFNGPATGEYYQAFGQKLDQLVDELLNE